LGGQYFAEAEKRGNLTLDQTARSEMRRYLQEYVSASLVSSRFTPNKGELIALEKLAKNARQVIANTRIIKSNFYFFDNEFVLDGIDYQQLENDLTNIVDHCIDLRKLYGGKGNRLNIAFAGLLLLLEETYGRASGKLPSLRRRKDDDARVSQFIDFAASALQCVPDMVKRPKSHQAIASFWERYNFPYIARASRSSRKKSHHPAKTK